MKKVEIGRSMVEMIAVISLMGMLSIGGVYSYKATIDRARATGIVGAVGKMLAIARVKGVEVNSETERMKEATNYGVKIFAQINGNDGIVHICGCDDADGWKKFENRLAEAFGGGVSFKNPADKSVACSGGTSQCSKIIFEEK